MSYHSEFDAEQAVEFYDPDRYMCQDDYEYFMRQGEYEMTQDATRKELNDYNSKPVEVSNDTPAGRATNRIFEGANVKGMRPDEIRDIIQDAIDELYKQYYSEGFAQAAKNVTEYYADKIKAATLEGIRLGLSAAAKCVRGEFENLCTMDSEAIDALDPATILAGSEKKS